MNQVFCENDYQINSLKLPILIAQLMNLDVKNKCLNFYTSLNDATKVYDFTSIHKLFKGYGNKYLLIHFNLYIFINNNRNNIYLQSSTYQYIRY
jgi:hypothetical protein